MAKGKKALGEKEIEDIWEEGVIWYTGNLERDFSRDSRISFGEEKRGKRRWMEMWKK